MKAVKFGFRENIEKMAGYTPGYQPAAGGGVVKINTNENPYPPSAKVMAALRGLVEEQVRKYPPVFWDNFRAAAAKLHGVRPEQIVCGNGGDELLAMMVQCCCDYDRPLAYPVPTYSLYPVLAMTMGPVAGTFISLAFKALVVAILTAYLRRFSTAILALCGSISFLAGLYNFLMVELYIRDIVTWIPI